MTSPLSVPLLLLQVRREEIRYKRVEPEQRRRDEFRDGYLCSSYIAFPTMPHPFAVLATQPRHAPGLGGHSYQVARRAEACTTAFAPNWHPIP